MNLVASVEMIEAPLEAALREANGLNDGVCEQLDHAQRHVRIALRFAREQALKVLPPAGSNPL